MEVRECMSTDVHLTNPEISVSEAAREMRDGNFGALPVGENDRLVGMITDRDIAIRVVADGRDPKTTTVRDAMSARLFYCFDDQPVDDAASIMAEHQVRRLPVLNRDKRLIGIVSLGDLATEAPSKTAASAALSDISS